MNIQMFSIGPLPTNAYIATCEETNKSLLIDPGWPDREFAEALKEYDVVHIVLTHSHWDHIGGVALAAKITGAPISIHAEAVPMLEAGGYASAMNLSLEPSPPPDYLISQGDTVVVGNTTFEVRFTPGHAPGHISLYSEADKVVFDGDVLFNKGIGRYDLPGGDYGLLMKSITEQLMTLPDEVVVYSGHGPKTTIGEERQFNPFL